MHHGMELVGIVSRYGQYHSINKVLDERRNALQRASQLALPQHDSSLFKVLLMLICSNKYFSYLFQILKHFK